MWQNNLFSKTLGQQNKFAFKKFFQIYNIKFILISTMTK